MKKNGIKLAVILMSLSSLVYAQDEEKDKFILSGEIRPRAEFLHGYKIPALEDQSSTSFVSQRTRLNLDYSMPKVKFGLVLQDVRNWGNQRQLVANEANAVSVHQAWAEVELANNFFLKAGRMELAYDDHRILGNVGWAQQARSHDLALFKYNGNINAHLGFAFHGNRYQGIDAYRDMQFLWLNGKAMDNALNWSFLFLNNGKAKAEMQADSLSIKNEKSVYSITTGPRLVFTKGGLTAALNFYYQAGNNPGTDWITGTSESNDQKLSAYNLGLDIGYKLNDNLLLGFGFEQLSGNDFTDVANYDQNAFTPFYGTNHKFNGWMDYFYVGNHGGNIGLTDIYGKLTFTKNAFFLKFIPHYFLPAGKNTYIDASSNTQDYGSLGVELDIWAGYHIVPKIASIEFGYSHMIPTESMLALKGIATDADLGASNWAWIMLVVKPQFFSK